MHVVVLGVVMAHHQKVVILQTHFSAELGRGLVPLLVGQALTGRLAKAEMEDGFLTIGAQFAELGTTAQEVIGSRCRASHGLRLLVVGHVRDRSPEASPGFDFDLH